MCVCVYRSPRCATDIHREKIHVENIFNERIQAKQVGARCKI